MNLVIVGAGGHGQVVGDIVIARQRAGCPDRLLAFADDNPATHGREILGATVVGGVDALSTIDHDALVVAIGDNRTRATIAAALATHGHQFATVCHPRAVIAPDTVIGPGTMACAGVIVNTGSNVGAHVILNTGCTVDHHARIGDHAHIGPGVHLGGSVTVGPRAFVGIGAAVLPGVSIGADAVVGAGAVVIRDVPAGATVVGVPARQIR